jgi:glutathione S-transferase
MQMSYPMEALVSRVGDLATKRLRDYVDQIHVQPAFRRAVDKGGPFDVA